MELRAIKSYYDGHLGLVTLEDDVLSIVRQIRERYGTRIKVSWEPTTGYYVLSEMCSDRNERLIFTTDTLDGRTLTRLMEADSQSPGYVDAYDAAEAEQDRLQEEIDEKQRERLRDPAEALVHALKKDGIEPHLPLTVPIPRGIDA
jgi:hypothetical protein